MTWISIPMEQIEATMAKYDLTLNEVLYAHTLYDPSLDCTMEEVYELVSDHKMISTTAELVDLLTHV